MLESNVISVHRTGKFCVSRERKKKNKTKKEKMF